MKLSVAIVAAAMSMSMVVPAFAAGSLTVPNSEGHTYDIFQIFTATYENDKLSDVKWGENGQLADKSDAETGKNVPTAILDELANVNKDGKTDREKLDVITKYADLEETAHKTSVAAGAKVDLEDGYYLVKDNATVSDDKEGNAVLSTYMVEVVGGEVVMTAKVGKPEFDKTVHDETEDAEDGAKEGWGETADHAINETFQFRLTATLPSDNKAIDDYKAYQLVFQDTLSNAVTFEKINSVKVYSKDKAGDVATITEGTGAGNYRTANLPTNGAAGGSWSLTIQDLKKAIPAGTSLQGLVVEVEYDAHLNENAALNNKDTNTNKAHLEYTRNPEWNGEGTPDNEKTPEDTVFVFTYDLPNKKVSEDGESPLTGAEFRLYNKAGAEVGLAWDEEKNAYRPVKEGEASVAMSSDKPGSVFNIIGLDAGEYTLKETKVPAGYTKADDMTITIKSKHYETGEGASANAEITKMVGSKPLGDGTNVVVNKKPSNLPETGGMGTTVIYSLGGLLVVGAGSILASRKKRLAK